MWFKTMKTWAARCAGLSLLSLAAVAGPVAAAELEELNVQSYPGTTLSLPLKVGVAEDDSRHPAEGLGHGCQPPRHGPNTRVIEQYAVAVCDEVDIDQPPESPAHEPDPVGNRASPAGGTGFRHRMR